MKHDENNNIMKNVAGELEILIIIKRIFEINQLILRTTYSTNREHNEDINDPPSDRVKMNFLSYFWRYGNGKITENYSKLKLQKKHHIMYIRICE